jgi:hypothetical protein
MTNKQLVQDLQTKLIEKVSQHMKNKNLHMVEFNTLFRVYVQEQTFDGDYMRVPLRARCLYQDGTIGTEDGSVILKELDIYELAYVVDVLEAGEYTVDDEEFIDPSGGRGLESHI